MTKIISWFSCGSTSAITTKLLLDEYGKDNVDIVYCKVREEHPDNERFMKDCEQKLFNKKVIVLVNEKYNGSLKEVINKKKMFQMGGVGASCTLNLKKRMRQRYEQETSIFTQGFGYHSKEVDRAIRFRENNPEITLLTPLIDKGWDKSYCVQYLRNYGIKLPVMYSLGFNNNNCIGCVKGGMGYWNKIKKVFPDEFKWFADKEREFEKHYRDRGLKSRPTVLKNKYLDELKPNEGIHSQENMTCDLLCGLELGKLKYFVNKT